MGLAKLEWHPYSGGGWVARIAIEYATNPSRFKYRRYAHVNIFDWIGGIKRRQHKGMVPVEFQNNLHDAELSWHDSVEAAKLHVEAIFALDND